MSNYRKSILAAIAAIVTAVVAGLTDGQFTAEEIWAVVIAGASAFGVLIVPNQPTDNDLNERRVI
jgi:hypothetical protein